jgi:uncharacterized phage protein (TIGR01671 family)
MGRVIKFRAFDPKKGMIEPYSVRHGMAWIMKPCRKDSPEVRVDGVNYYCNWDIDIPTTFPLMQFTGILDINGVEIYEGDIVSDHLGVGLVRYSEKHAAFRVSYGDGFAKWFYDYILKGERESIAVIGNIHQNKELLTHG